MKSKNKGIALSSHTPKYNKHYRLPVFTYEDSMCAEREGWLEFEWENIAAIFVWYQELQGTCVNVPPNKLLRLTIMNVV